VVKLPPAPPAIAGGAAGTVTPTTQAPPALGVEPGVEATIIEPPGGAGTIGLGNLGAVGKSSGKSPGKWKRKLLLEVSGAKKPAAAAGKRGRAKIAGDLDTTGEPVPPDLTKEPPPPLIDVTKKWKKRAAGRDLTEDELAEMKEELRLAAKRPGFEESPAPTANDEPKGPIEDASKGATKDAAKDTTKNASVRRK
jgi:hypothetical protein